MSQPIRKLSFVIALTILSHLAPFTAPTQAADNDAQESPDLATLINNTSFVWVKPDAATDLQEIAKTFAGKEINLITTYDALGGFTVQMNPVAAQARLDQLKSDESEEIKKTANEIDYIESNGAILMFDDSICNQATTAPLSALSGVEQSHAPWLTRTTGEKSPIQPQGSNFKATVYVIDSGISTVYDDNGTNSYSELNVDRAHSGICKDSGCTVPGDSDDRLGHGTFVAGIIGAQSNGRWFVGIAPNVKLIAIKIFDKRPVIDWSVAYQAIDWLAQKVKQGVVKPGDVVNISWGGSWDPNKNHNPRKIEALLHDMADKGIRISVAAGNRDALPGSAYVQAISPARAGAYHPTVGGGGVFTASAVDQNDNFWRYSGFGNCSEKKADCDPALAQEGPPDFAEPGTDIASLWPGLLMNKCSGTSFSAAILSGILVQGKSPPVQADGRATGDLDDRVNSNPVSPNYDDPIGVCTQGNDGICHEQ